MKKITLVTDAWHPQINGVVTTLAMTVRYLREFGYQVEVIVPSQFRSFPCPSYPEISLAFVTPRTLRKRLFASNPHGIHIATEGPLGWAARAVCRGAGFAFTTSYHTRFPEYLRLRWPVPLGLSYRVLRTFHRAAARTMVATTALREELRSRGFDHTVLWSPGKRHAPILSVSCWSNMPTVSWDWRRRDRNATSISDAAP